MGRHLFKFEGVFEVVMLFKLLTICMNMAPSYGQPGFLSLDCGSGRGDYEDDIGLSWVNDEPYIGSGISSRPFKVNSSDWDNGHALESFRYFPEPRNKYCYDLPTDPNVYYLIRPMFYYNMSESELLRLPVVFDVFINNTNWFTVNILEYEYEYTYQNTQEEGIFYSGGPVIYFCLVPINDSIPFISSLELRRLDPDMYKYVGSKYRYLSLLERRNYGASFDTPTVRFPDDPFDRFWWPSSENSDNSLSKRTSGPNANTSDVNNVPNKVMQDAEILDYTSVELPPTDIIYVVAYFEDLKANESEGQVKTMDIRDSQDPEVEYVSRTFNITAKASMQVFPNLVVAENYTYINLSFVGSNSTLNALEVYTAPRLLTAYYTDYDEDLEIEALKRTFNLTSWHGDPCYPKPHNWVRCYDIYHSTYITSITLSHLRGDGWPSLMNTSLSDHINISTLSQLSLTHSEINNVIFQFLIESFASPAYLYTLDLSYNNVSSIPPSIPWSNTYLGYLDLSHNRLNGVLPLFTTSFLNGSRYYLQHLNVSNNNIIGVHPDDLYFSNDTSLQTMNFDSNNIEGTLNLTTWHDSLNQNLTLPGPLFTFVNNNITDIIPSIEVLKSIIDKRMFDKDPRFNETGVLLGGNPYCKDVKSTTHQYLCRNKVVDIIHRDKKKSNTLLLAGTIGGALLFLICCVLFATSWKLWKKVSALRQIQQALANQKVQPPFYTYNELKLATKDFHKNNKLGNGAFGIVYKGVLPNGSAFAVKKLFNSQQVQVLNEFLNEVVLITGIKHKNLVQLKGCCINDQQRILVYEYVENGNLAEALWDKKKPDTPILDWRQCFNICVGIARGLLYLHEELQPRIIHRDIKPANILLDKNLNPKIADFGLARRFLDDQSQAQFTNVAGTQGYFAPEYASEGKLTEKADVYSFGILILEIVSGRKAIDYNMPSERVFLKDWVQKLHKDGMLMEVLQPDLPQNFVEDEVMRVINIALICVQMDSERRATMSQVLTMLLGSMDVTVFLDMGNQYAPNFNNLLPFNESHSVTNISTFHECNAIVEECDESPLLQVDSKSSLPSHSNIRTHSIPTVELSDMSGR